MKRLGWNMPIHILATATNTFFKTHRYFGLDFCAVQAECGLLSHTFGFIIDQIIIPIQ